MSSCNRAISTAVFFALREMEQRKVFTIDSSEAIGLIDKMRELMQEHTIEKDKKHLRRSENRSSIEYNIVAKSQLGGINFLEDITEPKILTADGETYLTLQDVDISFEETMMRETGFLEEYVKAKEDFVESVRLPFDDAESKQIYRLGTQMADADMMTYTSMMVSKFTEAVLPEKVIEYIRYNMDTRASQSTLMVSLLANAQTIANGLLKLNGRELEDTVYAIKPSDYENIKEIFAELMDTVTTHLKESGEHSELEDDISLALENIANSDDIIIECYEDIARASDTKMKEQLFSLLYSAKTADFRQFQIDARSIMWDMYDHENFSEVLKETKKAEFSLTASLDTRKVLSFPTPFDHENAMEVDEQDQHILPFISHKHVYMSLNDDLHHYDELDAHAKHVEVGLLKGRFTQEITYDDSIPIAKSTNQMFSKNAFFSRDYVTKHPILLIDESDNGIKGAKNEVARVMGSYANNVISASGTATNGKPSDMSYHLGISGLSNQVIDENAKNLMTQCGVYEIKSDFVRLCLIHNTGDQLSAAMDSYRTAKQSRSVVDLTKLSADVVRSILYHLDAVEDISSLDTVKAQKDIERVISSAESLTGSIPSSNEQALQYVLLRSRSQNSSRLGVSSLLGEYPGINNPKTFTSIIKSQPGNPSIQSRENLKQRTETMDFLDIGQASRKTADKLGEINQKDIRAKVFFEVLKAYAKENFVMDLFSFTTENFSLFADLLKNKKNLSIALESAGHEEFDPKMFVSLMSRSKKSIPDDLSSLYKHYIKRNGDMEAVSTRFGAEKAEILAIAIKAFSNEILDNINELRNTLEGAKKGKVVLRSPNGFEIKGALRLPEKFSRGKDNEILLSSFDFIDGYPTLEGKKIETSFHISLDNDDWSEFTTYRNDFWYELPNSKNEELIDFYTNSNMDKLFLNEIDEGNKSIIPSSRDLGTVFNIFNFIKMASRRESNDRAIVLIVNSQGNKEVSSAIKSLDPAFLSKHRIEIAPTSSNRIQATVNEFKNKKIDYNVFSNYISIARGLDLSSMDKILVTGMLANPNDAIQMLARVFSVDRDDGEIYLFGGGNNYSLRNVLTEGHGKAADMIEEMMAGAVMTDNGIALSVEGAKPHLPAVDIDVDVIGPTQSDKVNLKLHRATEVYKGFMGGTMASTKQTQTETPFKVATGYAKKLEALKGAQRQTQEQTQTNPKVGV